MNIQNDCSQRHDWSTAIVMMVSALAFFAFTLAISADAGVVSSTCPSCGLTTKDLSRHKCSPTPKNPAELAIRKYEAHALSEKSQSDWKLKSYSGDAVSSLSEFIRSKEHLIALGKSLFWEERVGSDDQTACATCHYHAGVDTRTKNTDSATNREQIRFNHQWRKADNVDSATVPDIGDEKHSFGLIRPRNEKLEHQTLIIGSQGIRPRRFDGLHLVNDIPTEKSRDLTDEERIVYGIGPQSQDRFRQVSRRNASTIINSTLLSRLFADGRAQPTFNGHDAFGDLYQTVPPVATYRTVNGKVEPVSISIPMAAAASQALAPLRSAEEMGYVGREPWDVAAKLLPTRPLLRQKVAMDDSVLGTLADSTGQGLRLTYQELIQHAFHDSWWKAPDTFTADSVIPSGENSINPPRDARGKPLTGSMALQAVNFPLYFGLAIMAYEQTLISDRSPFDRYCEGETTAISRRAIRGFEKFRSYGCADCHLQPEFAGATSAAVFGDADPPDDEYEEPGTKPRPLTRPLNAPSAGKFVEEMKPVELRRGLLQNTDRFFAYDGGFYNIGVTALWWKDRYGKFWREDWGVGRSFPEDRDVTAFPSGSLDYSRAWQRFPGENLREDDQSRVRGAFKTPSLRNVELTKPYMHNGAFLTLEDVMAFYERGPRDFDDDHPDAKYWHHPALAQLREQLNRDSEASADIVAFLKSLTDERVRRHAAPFDHPSLNLPVGSTEQVVPPRTADPQNSPLAQRIQMIRHASIAERSGSITNIRDTYTMILRRALSEDLDLKSLTEDNLVDKLVPQIAKKLGKEKDEAFMRSLNDAVSGLRTQLIKSGSANEPPIEQLIVRELMKNETFKDALSGVLGPRVDPVLTPNPEPMEVTAELPAIGRNGSDNPLAGIPNWDALPE